MKKRLESPAWEPLATHIKTRLDDVIHTIPADLRSDVCVISVFVGYEESSVLPFATVSWNTRAQLRMRAAEIGRGSALAEWGFTEFASPEAAVVGAADSDPNGFEIRRRSIRDQGLSLEGTEAGEDTIDREAAIWDGFIGAVVIAVARVHATGVLDRVLGRVVPIFIDVQDFDLEELVEFNRQANPEDLWPVLDRLSGRPIGQVGTWWQ